jgi:hypothetical protein
MDPPLADHQANISAPARLLCRRGDQRQPVSWLLLQRELTSSEHAYGRSSAERDC